MSYVIGSADGPTSVFVAGKIGIHWLNIFGLAVIVLLMLPNIIFAIRFRGQENEYSRGKMIILEQIGRYASMFLMIFNIGIAEFGFGSVAAFLVYGAGNIILMAAYWILWMLYFIKPAFWKSMALAVVPTCIFLLSGITLGHVLLVISSVIFGIGHIYVTYRNARNLK